MKKRIFLLFLCLILVVGGCSTQTNLTENAVNDLFSLLRQGRFTEASAYFLPGEDGASAEIADTALNRARFAGIEADVWRADKNEAELCITQKSMHRVYALAMEKTAGLAFSTDTDKQLWANAVAEALNETTETAVFVVTVPLSYETETVRLKMTNELRNALFGGELDAINAFDKIGENDHG